MRCSRRRAGPGSESWTSWRCSDLRGRVTSAPKPSIVAPSNRRGNFGEVRLGDRGEPGVCPLLLLERLAQFRRVGCFGETRQCPHQLNLRAVEHAELVEIEIFQRPETHGSPQRPSTLGGITQGVCLSSLTAKR